MASFDQTLNVGIPLLLLAVAVGFVYTKFLNPFLLPLLKKLWDSVKGKKEDNQISVREITYE